MKQGYIKLHRSLLDWEWYTDVNTFKLFTHCLMKANHIDKNWRGKIIQRGSFITSLRNLSTESGLTIQQIRTALNKLKSTHELTSKATSQNTVITINNYEQYQDINTQSNKQITTTKNIYNTINNNINNIKSRDKNKNFTPPSLDEIKIYCLERKNNINPEQFWDFYSAKGWMIGKNKMKDWRAAVRTWEKREKKNTPQGAIQPSDLYD